MWTFIITVFGIFVATESLYPSGKCSLPAKGIRRFPPNFSFGAATSAYQIEGGWNADGKGPSIWDDFVHKHPDKIMDKTNGDVAADSYNQFDSDLKALTFLKVNHYRFSIAWTRIYPTGDISSKNQKGIDYYNKMIDKLIASGITPVITMFHYDLPAEIQKLGGLTNELFIDYFVTFAEELFKNFGDRVKTWLTFNEPVRFCRPSYGSGRDPPQVEAPGLGDYLCYANILKSHASVYHLYRQKYYQQQRGKIGLAIDSSFYFSKENDTATVDRSLQYNFGIVAHAVYSRTGGFPPLLVNEIAWNSFREGRIRSRLPDLQGKWKDFIRGSADFLGINQYTSWYVKRSSKPMGKSPSWERDYNTEETSNEKALKGKSSWLYCVPEGIEGLLKYIRDEYNNVEVMITENGWSDTGELNDDNRIIFMKSYIQGVLNAVNDGCNVSGYTYWSLLDSFEWARGYTERFGLFYVDLNSTTRERTPKKSAQYYRQLIQSREIPNFGDH